MNDTPSIFSKLLQRPNPRRISESIQPHGVERHTNGFEDEKHIDWLVLVRTGFSSRDRER